MDYIKLAMFSPYPIYLETLDYYIGEFHHGSHVDFNPCIKLDKSLRGAKKLAILIHELTHARHYKRHCKCYRSDNRYLRELHAYRFTLRFAIRYKLTDIVKWEYNRMTECDNCDCSDVYCRVFVQLKTEKIWKEVKEFLGK